MEEELNENELEEQFYSMLHYVDETQANIIPQQNAVNILENAPRGTMRRYWRTNGEDTTSLNNPYQKINTQQDKPNTPKETTTNKIITLKEQTTCKNYTVKPKNKGRNTKRPVLPIPSLFQSPVPQNMKKTIEFIDHVIKNVVELESSDEDEVIEVAVPPKPTITIDSSEEEDDTLHKLKNKDKLAQDKPNTEREVSASPVPTVVSSMSDEFIRGDCIALNISSRHPDDHSFDFSLHGADFLGQSTPAKKRKKKKNKDNSSTSIVTESPIKHGNVSEGCFATPKTKSKNKRQRAKSYTVTEKSVPSADVYDSDSNQSTDTNKKPYLVTEKSLPSADVYETNSNMAETIKVNSQSLLSNHLVDQDSFDSSISLDKFYETNKDNTINLVEDDTSVVDLTGRTLPINSNKIIHESIVIGNVTGFTESEDKEKNKSQVDIRKLGSTKVPPILYEDLDFDNLKGIDKVCKNRRYSLTTLRAEMEKFYNESWGGEDFNHREIQKNMSRDKSLWAIDAKDKWPAMNRNKRRMCNYCNRPGHRDDTCRQRPPICHMCGTLGHLEPRCPGKICVNCGSPNHVYSTMCRNCSMWGHLACNECGQRGHPASHCPDLWRRYHNTIDFASQLEESLHTKKHYQLFCSGCTRRGHLVNTCRVTLPFSGLPINSPYVQMYRPIFAPPPEEMQQQRFITTQDNTITSEMLNQRNDFRANKRQSKSPAHENHYNKKINVSGTDDISRNSKSPAPQRKLSQSKEQVGDTNAATHEKSVQSTAAPVVDAEKAPDFIPITSANYDDSGHVIQDTEVSDTSDVITSAKIYVTDDIIDNLKTNKGSVWLKETMDKLNVTVENTDAHSFLSIKGKVGDQESFQSALRDWIKGNTKENSISKSDSEAIVTQESNSNELASNNIPKNRNNVLRKLSKALESLKGDLGEPKAIFNQLNYHKHKQKQLLKKKVVSPQQLVNNRARINEALKKLNMVLLGQAGLADGRLHLTKLYSIQEKLIHFRQKNISSKLRTEIGEHFHTIFTANPRDDYKELLNNYYGFEQAPSTIDKKQNKVKLSPKKKLLNPILPQQRNRNDNAPIFLSGVMKDGNFGNMTQKNVNQTRHLESWRSKLVFYHQRLQRIQPKDGVHKKTRLVLMRKLLKSITDCTNKSNVAFSKALMKMRKVQNEARIFFNSL